MTPRLDEEFISNNLERYRDTQGVLPERLDHFGDLYREQGHLTQDQLYEIAYESSTRSAHYVNQNPADRCQRVTRNITDIDGDFSKMTLLTGLSGFKAATASCVLTAINPEKHAVVDTRVWASLERFDYFDDRRETFGPTHYVRMIDTIRSISDKTNYTTAKIGYALFAYDDHVREGNLH